MNSSPLSKVFQRSGSRIGRSTTSGRSIYLEDAQRSTYIVGKHGVGKSNLILSLVLDDIEREDKGIVVLDPHGDLAKDVVERCPPGQSDRVVYFAPAEQRKRILGFNPFENSDQEAYELKAGALMDVFAHTWYGGYSSAPTMQNTLETLVRTLLAAYPEHQTTFLHMLLLTQLDSLGDIWRSELAQFVSENPALRQNWIEWTDRKRLRVDMESSRQKIKHIMTSTMLFPILCQPQSARCFSFQDVLSSRGVLLINLSGLDDEGQRLLGSLLLTALVVMAKSRHQEVDRTPCHIYADEFYKFSPQSFVTIINELRKFGLFCTIAHQSLAQLGQSAKAAAANCGNVIAFQVNPSDSAALARHYLSGGRPLPGHYLSNLPKFRALVRFEGKNLRHQTEVDTYPESRGPDENVEQNILSRSSGYGVPHDQVMRVIRNAILNAGSDTSKRSTKPNTTRLRRRSDDRHETRT